MQRDTVLEILQPVAISCLSSLGLNSILQHDNAHPHKEVERMELLVCSPDLIPPEHLWDQLGRAVHARLINTTTLADLRQMVVEEWDAIPQQCLQLFWEGFPQV
uniref:Tc1-like transposase DDE domain-containing protein n=1 Tax=Amphilophus citrinellus TaxID=61819 RepID=A0A3Q0R994_AMPCI